MIEIIHYIYDSKVWFVLTIIYLLYKLGTFKHTLHLKLGHKGPSPWPFFGNLVPAGLYGIHEYDKLCLKKYGRIYPFYLGNIPISMISDEELLKQILIKESKCFTDRMNFGLRGKVTEKMITLLKGKDWERVRNLLTPTFTSGKLKKMTPLISDGVKLLEDRLAKHSIDNTIDFKEFFGALTMDVIARTMFAMHIDSQTNPNNLFITHAKKLFRFSFFNPMVMVFLIFPFTSKLIYKILPKFNVFGQETMEFYNSNLMKAIEERRKSTEEYNDFLALMLKAHKDIDDDNQEAVKNLDSKSLTTQEIMAQSLIFLLAGYDTTATTLTYVAYFMAKNPDAQREVYEEIVQNIGKEGEIQYETIMSMPLLDAAINETLRICPPAVRIDRVCTQDITLVTSDNQKIQAKKGDIFTVPIYAIQTDPTIWSEPDAFDMHRFDLENKKNRSIYAHLPFGMGPRNCVGMRFALLEAKWALIKVLSKYEIVPCEETLEVLKFSTKGNSSPVKPILLKIKPRK